MIKKTLLAVAAVLVIAAAVVLVYAATKPDDFRIEYAAAIKAPPEKIFPYLNDLTLYRQWSPWEDKDPNMKRELSGPSSGTGAVYSWHGNSEVGVGSMKIVESTPPKKVVYGLEFKEPFEGSNSAAMSISSDGTVSTVTWAFYGKDPYIAKLITVFCDRDGMLTEEFKKGLARLKTLAEK